jgi:DNA polymerase-3 subunit alpha
LSEFVHCHAHNHDSLLDGVGTQDQHVARVAEMGQGALAETNHGVLSGSLDHLRACRKYGVVPLIGVEAYFRPNRLERNKGEKAYHQILIAKNIQGWHNLIRLTTVGHTHQAEGGGFYGKPCVDWEIIEKYSEGLICTTACIGSYLSFLMQQGDEKGTNEYLNRLKKIYGNDLFLEIQPHDIALQCEYNIAIVRMAREHSLPIVATGDVHYPYEGWGTTQQIAKMIATQTSFKKLEDDAKRKAEGKFRRDDDADTAAAERRRQGEDVFTRRIDTAYLMSADEMRESFTKWHPHLDEQVVSEALSNTSLVASRCIPFLIDKSVKVPKVTSGPDEAEKILRKWIDEGLAKRFSDQPVPQEYRDRIDFELSVIRKRQVLDDFVLFTRWIHWMKSDEPLPGDTGTKEPIEIGDGRGSVGGSLVAYLLGYTTLDPIAYGLKFERFLNPDRKGLPDIDQDIDVTRRDEAKEWWPRTVGYEYVAEVGTFRDFHPKNVIADVGRVFDVPRSVTLALNKTYEVTVVSEETTLEQIRQVNPKLQEFADKFPDVYKEALRLEGQKAGAGKHAAGIVVGDRPLNEFMPVHKPPNVSTDVPWRLVTSWTGSAKYNAIDDIGLVKKDALGVKPPTKFAYARKLIRKHHGVDITSDLPVGRDPYAVDPKVMEIFCKGETVGIFQFATPVMTHLVKQIQPTNMHDLAACNALVRPGTSKVAYEYGRRKRVPELVEYWTPELEPILNVNYGLLIYQEDAMAIVQALADLTPGQADDFRKAMGKYYRLGKVEAQKFMQRYWQQWKDGHRKRGISDEVRDYGWEKILELGGYAFNKSHAELYSMTAYREAWLKTHYPDAFYAATLTYEKDEEDRLSAINEARAKKQSLLPPEVGISQEGFELSSDGIHFGFEAIKGIGQKAAHRLAYQVTHNYASMDDFREDFPKNVVEALEEAGALDKFGGRKGWDDDTKAQLERNRLGLTLTGPPVHERWADLIESREGWVSKTDYENLPAGPKWAKGNEGMITIGGEIIALETPKIKNGKNKGRTYARFKIAYGPDTFSCVMFSDTFDRLGGLLLERPAAVLVHGRKSEDGPDSDIIVDQMASVVAVENQLKRAA